MICNEYHFQDALGTDQHDSPFAVAFAIDHRGASSMNDLPGM